MNIQNIISLIGLKIILGLVLASVMIFSMGYILKELHIYLSQFSASNSLQLISFIAILFASAIGFYFVFQSTRRSSSEVSSDKVNALLLVDFKRVGMKFLEGFLDGFLRRDP